MVEDVKIKTHLIITNLREEYSIKWCGKIVDTNPLFVNNKPVFVVVGDKKRVELNTCDMKQIEDCAKRLTNPKGKAAVTTDTAFIYIKEIDKKETLIGTVRHNHIKTFAPIYDSVGYM